jgi:hypothetical protein
MTLSLTQIHSQLVYEMIKKFTLNGNTKNSFINPAPKLTNAVDKPEHDLGIPQKGGKVDEEGTAKTPALQLVQRIEDKGKLDTVDKPEHDLNT